MRTPLRRHRARPLILATLFTTALVIAAFAFPRERAHPPTPIAVTAYPLLDIVRSVAGTDLPVASVLPPGGNAHTFEPNPSTVALLSQAKVVYAIGHGFDDWIDGALGETDAMKVVVDPGIVLRDTAEGAHAEDGADDDDAHGPVDPHYWLDGRNAMQIARTVAADLTSRFPSHGDDIARNLAVTLERIATADARARAVLADAPDRSVVTLHDAWYYFADAYGLSVVGSFEPTAGREPSPRYLAELEDAVRTSGARILFTEPGGATATIRAFAKDNGLAVIELDPMEGADQAPYDVILLRNAQTIRDSRR